MLDNLWTKYGCDKRVAALARLGISRTVERGKGAVTVVMTAVADAGRRSWNYIDGGASSKVAMDAPHTHPAASTSRRRGWHLMLLETRRLIPSPGGSSQLQASGHRRQGTASPSWMTWWIARRA